MIQVKLIYSASLLVNGKNIITVASKGIITMFLLFLKLERERTANVPFITGY
jgi:hypothetical protein